MLLKLNISNKNVKKISNNIWLDQSSVFYVLHVLFSPSWWRSFISFSSAWKLCCISTVLWNEPLSFLLLFILLYLSISHNASFPAAGHVACVLTGCDDGSFNQCRWARGAGRLESEARGEGLDDTFVTVDSRIMTCLLKLFHPSATCLPLCDGLALGSIIHLLPLLSCADFHSPWKSFTVVQSNVTQWFLHSYCEHIFVFLCLCRDKAAVTLLLQSLTWRQRSMCRCPKVMSTKRRR